VEAVNGDGAGEQSNRVDLVAGVCDLPAPTGLKATAQGGGWVGLQWNNVPGASSYRVFMGTSPGGQGQAVYGGSNSAYWYGQFEPGKTYYFQVSAVNGTGESRRTSQVSVRVE
jgi:pectate lyase